MNHKFQWQVQIEQIMCTSANNYIGCQKLTHFITINITSDLCQKIMIIF